MRPQYEYKLKNGKYRMGVHTLFYKSEYLIYNPTRNKRITNMVAAGQGLDLYFYINRNSIPFLMIFTIKRYIPIPSSVHGIVMYFENVFARIKRKIPLNS